jgi:hypothetical protein
MRGRVGALVTNRCRRSAIRDRELAGRHTGMEGAGESVVNPQRLEEAKERREGARVAGRRPALVAGTSSARPKPAVPARYPDPSLTSGPRRILAVVDPPAKGGARSARPGANSGLAVRGDHRII